MNHKKLFELAKPFLEKNDFGVEHTKRVYNVATTYFTIPENIRDLVYSSIILHDIGGSSIKDQYKKGPKIAKKLLEQLNCPQDFIREVCEIIMTHHSHLDNPSLSFQILYDADKLVMLSEEEYLHYNSNPNFSWNHIFTLFYSDKIRKLAKQFLKKRKLNNI